jgi:putative selenium metabolism hydrolase
MKFNEIMNKAKGYEQLTAELLSRLVQTPSYSGKEAEMVKIIEAEMTAIGFDEVKIDALGSIIGRIGSGKRIIAFDAHIDTVYPGVIEDWHFLPHAGLIKKGRVWGRGASDQLGGMAAMLTAARIIKELDLNNFFTILFTGSVMEEDCDGIAWDHLIRIDGITPELVVSTEPTSLKLHRGHRGRMEIEVEVKGVSCHGSAPDRGINAIYKMAAIIREIEALSPGLKYDNFLGKGTVTTTIIQSNSASQCSVPDWAKIVLDRRLTTGETKDSALKEIRNCCRQAGINDAVIKVPIYNGKGYTGKIYPQEKYFPTWTLPEDSSWLQSAIRAYKQLFIASPVIDKWTFSTNCVFIMGKHPNIKCLGFGPGDESQAHSANESVKISDLWQAAAFYAGLVAELNLGEKS